MSYGRSPYYIYSDNTYMHFHGDKCNDAAIPMDAIAQMVTHMAARGEGPGGVDDIIGRFQRWLREEEGR